MITCDDCGEEMDDCEKVVVFEPDAYIVCEECWKDGKMAEKFGPPLTPEEERLWRMDSDGADEDHSHAYFCGRVFATMDARVAALEAQLKLAVKVAEAARWACVAVLDQDTPAAEMAEIRPLAAEQLLDMLKLYDDDREKRGIITVSEVNR